MSRRWARIGAAPGLAPANALLAAAALTLGCHRGALDTASTPTLVVAWGDLHAHSGLSQDGCEDPDALCLPDADLPGEAFFDNAATNGLAFAALTDHAEFVTYRRPADGVEIDTWERAQELVTAAEAGPVIPILGYEWTADGVDEDQVGVHRTVLLEDPAACSAFRVPGYPQPDLKETFPALEDYVANPAPSVVDSRELEAALEAAGDTAGCAPTRAVSFLHHVAESPPASVDWTNPAFPLATDSVVEIASEHGSSECADLDSDGCDWHAQSEVYVASGSVQAALALGLRLGFVGGTDRHDADPGRLDDGPGPSSHLYDSDGDGVEDSAYLQYTTGTLTGVLAPQPLTRAAIFDALQARHTLVGSRAFAGLDIHAQDASGATWLPGDELPAGTYTLVVTLDDPAVTDWTAERVDPANGTHPLEAFTLAAGDVAYVRVRATVNGVEHRAWASPFFGS